MAADEEVAHIVHPGTKMNELASGLKSKVKALCGAWVVKRVGQDANVCRGCFDKYNDGSLFGGEEGAEKAAAAK